VRPERVRRGTPEERRALAKKLRRARNHYEGEGATLPWLVNANDIRTVYNNLEFNIADIRMLRQATPNRRLRVLDLGCLEGTAISQLATEYPQEIEAHGLSLRRSKQGGNQKTFHGTLHTHTTRAFQTTTSTLSTRISE